MKKRMSIVEQILVYNLIIFFVLSIIIGFVCNGSEAMKMFWEAVSYGFSVIFIRNVFAACMFIAILIIIFGIIGYWAIKIIGSRRITLGPVYILLFFIILIYTNGYCNIMFYIDAYCVILFMILICLIVSSAISFIVFYKEVQRELEGENNE